MISTSRSSGRLPIAALTVLLLSGLCAAAGTPAQASPVPQAALTTVASFNGTNGDQPQAGVTFDRQGNLFGTTSGGGTSYNGTVYEIAKGSTAITDIASVSGTDGDQPNVAVTFDGSGNLFGTITQDGTNGKGTVFEIMKGSTSIKTLASFNGTNGSRPRAPVTFDSQGNLFGTTNYGGANDNGTVFEITKGSTVITDLSLFYDTNGKNPVSGVTFDSQGNLFGTTESGGASDDGTVYEIAKGSTAITNIASFTGTDGASPVAAVTFDSQGNLFGTTTQGGAKNEGTVYEIIKGSTHITSVASFNGKNGKNPCSRVTFDSNDNLFGTTTEGGAKDEGTVYEITQSSTAIIDLVSFNSTNGRTPSEVTFDSNGNLFGTTSGGGRDDYGTVFEIAGVGSPSAAPGSSSAVPKSPRRAALFPAALLVVLLLTVLGLGGLALRARKRTRDTNAAE